MKRFASVAIMSLCTTTAAWAGPTCTTADKSKWQDATQFQERLKAEGYEIKNFKITKGNCYEIYGWDKQRVKVEIYFDPVTGKAVKTETG